MKTTKTLLLSLGLGSALTLGFTSCEQPMIELPGDPLSESQQARGPDYGIDHDDILGNVGDVFKDGRQVPPAIGERLHSCGKLRYESVLDILKSRGLNIGNGDPNSVGGLVKRAQPVWGVANFIGRVPESTRNSTSSLVSLEDIAVAMGEELISMTNLEGAWPAMSGACSGEKLFDGMTCNRDGFACLLGATPSQRQLELCNSMVKSTDTGVTDELTRKRLTVAALVGTVYLCD
jgi:hypothetical protein